MNKILSYQAYFASFYFNFNQTKTKVIHANFSDGVLRDFVGKKVYGFLMKAICEMVSGLDTQHGRKKWLRI